MKKSLPNERIALISDGTCDTAEHFVRAILAQFNRTEAELVRVPRVRTETQVEEALDKLTPPFLVAYTFAKEQLRKSMWAELKKRKLIGLDILYPAIDIFAEFLKDDPSQKTGMLHSMKAENYFERIEAIEFAVKHDDGLRSDDLSDADLILTGVSRTSKTPTSMYLALKGFKVANVPLVNGIEPPPGLLNAQKRGVTVVLLIIDASSLQRIRRSRFDRLGVEDTGEDTYTDQRIIRDELQSSLALARHHGWHVIDVTNKAVEETASEILLKLKNNAVS